MNVRRNPKEIISQTQSLYSLPGVAAQVLELTRTPQIDIAELKNCLEQDPALVIKLLRVVNSSLFGLSRSVVDLTQAMNVLGINPLRMLVLGFCLPERLFLFVNRDILGRYWHRTLLKATIARKLSKYRKTNSSGSEDDAFIAGLLGDIGLLVMLQEYNDAFAKFLDVALAKAGSLIQYEQKALGVDHFSLGSALIDRWNLPSHLVRLVEAGTEQDRINKLPVSEQPLAQILQIADKLAWSLAEERDDFWPEIYSMINKSQLLTQDQLQNLVSEVQLQVEQLAEALHLPEFTTEKYELLTLNALERLSQLTEEQILQTMRSLQLRPLESVESETRALQAAVENNLTNTAQAKARLLESLQSSNNLNNTTDPDRFDPLYGDVDADAPNNRLGSSSTTNGSSRNYLDIRKLNVANSTDLLHKEINLPENSTTKPKTKPKTFSGQIIPEVLRQPLNAALLACRQAHQSLSLMLVDVDYYDELAQNRGLVKAEHLNNSLAKLCQSIDLSGAKSIQLLNSQYAILLPNCDRRHAVEYANNLLRRTDGLTKNDSADQTGMQMTISVGVATISQIPRNYSVEPIFNGAIGCLSGAQLSGGKSVKSIEVF